MALAQKYFQVEGLEPGFILTGSGSKTIAAVVSGSIDFAASALPSLIEARMKGQNLVALTALSTQALTAVMRKEVAKEKGITETSPLEQRVKAMKGLRIGATAPGSGGYRVLALILRHYGLDPERDVRIQPLTSGGAMVAAVVRAMAKANRFIATNKDGTREVLERAMKGISPEAFRIGFEANYPAMAKDPVIPRRGFEANYQFVDGAEKNVPYEPAVNTTFATEARQAVGTK